MHRFFSAAMAAAVCLAVSVPPSAAIAQTVSNPTTVVSNYDISSIEPILTELGVTHERKISSANESYLVAHSHGINFLLLPRACDEGAMLNCLGLAMGAYFPYATTEEVNKFNLQTLVAKAQVLNADTTVVDRYLVGSHGYTRGSFAANVSVFVAAALKYQRREHAQPSNMISLQAEAADSAAAAPKVSNLPGGEAHTLGAEAFATSLIGLYAQDLVANGADDEIFNDFAQ